jgi:3-dehydroquinate dehydratase type I
MASAAEVLFPSRICVSLGHHDPERLLKLGHLEAERGETFFEFCLEFLTDPKNGPHIIRDFLRHWPHAWIIATCRRQERNFQGCIEDQLAVLGEAVEAGARGIDLEIETARHNRQWMHDMGRQCMRIVSYHNHHGCPALGPVIRELESIPADLIKVAVKAGNSGTLHRLAQAAGKCTKPNLMLMMGKEGLPLRIMAPILGRSFTYASPADHEGTASGQLDASILREILHLDQLEIKAPLAAATR